MVSRIYNFFSKSSIIIFEDFEKKLNWNELEEIYRRLKQSYQRYGDYSIAGDLYYQEMECKRKQLGFFRRHFWNIVYRGLCGYGEAPFRVIFASLFIIIGFSFLYYYNGIKFLGESIKHNLSFNSFDISFLIRNYDILIKDFLFCIYTSVITFTTLGYGDVHPIGLSRFFASIESGLGIFMTALFIFVFTRKMLR